MYSKTKLHADGSSMADRHPPVVVDREEEPWRWRCVERDHTRWDPTNNHVWCKSCAEAAEGGADVEPEQWELYDAKESRAVPWDAVVLVA